MQTRNFDCFPKKTGVILCHKIISNDILNLVEENYFSGFMTSSPSSHTQVREIRKRWNNGAIKSTKSGDKIGTSA